MHIRKLFINDVPTELSFMVTLKAEEISIQDQHMNHELVWTHPLPVLAYVTHFEP